MDKRKVLKTLTEMKMQNDGGILHVGGFSMIPLLVPGDIVRLVRLERYKVGDIVVCIDDNARLLIHRIINIVKVNSQENKKSTLLKYITKGDNAVATEVISQEFCIGKVAEITNANGKHIEMKNLTEHDKEVVRLSRKVNSIYIKTQDPNIAFSSKYHMTIYDMAPDYLKKHVYEAQDFMIKKSIEFMGNMLPDMVKTQDLYDKHQDFEFTRDFYSMLITHRVLNILSPYVYSISGRFGKFLKLAKANNYAGAARRFDMAVKIAEEFERAGVKYVLYKGIAASYAIYGDTNIRECDDIDFLILPQDKKKAHQAMYRLEFSHLDQNAETLSFFRTEEPTELYHTHLMPYAHPETGITVELHTAIFVVEDQTPSILDGRRKITIKGHDLYVLNEIDAYVCQLYITAMDDFGCSNMSYIEDPNIFFRLKFRNYVDICMMTLKFNYINVEEILAAARKYDISFYIYSALFFTCEIYEYAPFTFYAEQIMKAVKKYQNINEKMYDLPVDAKECLRTPFKMKMNGEALRNLRDAFYISSQQIVNADALEISKGENVTANINGVSEKIYCTGNRIVFNFEIDESIRRDEYILLIRGFYEEEKPKKDVPYYTVKYIYRNVQKNITKRGVFYMTRLLPQSVIAQNIYDRIKSNIYYDEKSQKNKLFNISFEMKRQFDEISYLCGSFHKDILDIEDKKTCNCINLDEFNHQIVKVVE